MSSKTVYTSKYMKVDKTSRWPWIVGLVVIGAAILAVLFFWGKNPTSEKPLPPKVESGKKVQTAAQSGEPEEKKLAALKPGEVYPSSPAPSVHGKIVNILPNTDAESKIQKSQIDEQQARKKPYGLDKSLDAVLRSDETIKIGNKTVTIAELEKKLIVEQRGDVVDKPLGKKARITAWGVHLVRPGENLWDIHFRLLREYMASRGVKLADTADRPTKNGYSSGVGKVLKFAEHMVGVFNVKTGHMHSDLNLLDPGNKIVIYSLSEIFDQLAKIDPHDLSGVMYDGRVLLFPESKPASKDESGKP